MTESKKNHESREFANNELKVRVSFEPHCVVRYEVEIAPEATLASHQKAIKNISKEVSLPGFRKGKAPSNVISERYKSHIQSEFREILINTTLQEAIKLSQIFPSNNNTIGDLKVGTVMPGETATISFKFEKYPEVPKIDPSQLKLKKVTPPTVNEESIEEVIDKIRRHHSQVQEITDRAVEEGDEVEVMLELMNPALKEPQKQVSRYDLREGKVDVDLLKVLKGVKLGETVDGSSALKQEVKNDEEKSSCRITVNRIRKVILPDLNDELAKKGGAENLEDLRAKVIKSLEKQIQDSVSDLKREQVQMALLETFPFDVPATILKREQERRAEIRIHNLEHAHLKEDQIDKLKSQIESETLREAEQFIRLQFLIHKYIDEHKIAPTQEELVQEMVKEMMHDKSAMQLKGEELRERAMNMVTAKKALDTMLSQAQIED